jgi:hypothetical protein
VLGALVLAPPAAAQEAGGWTAPAYPGNTLTMVHDGPIVAGTVVRVKLSGHAEWDEPTDELTTPYDLSLFAQNPDIEPACAPSYGSQLQMGINIDLNASTSISGWVMDGDLHVYPSPPATGIDWSGESVPFSIKPGLDRVLLCGFQRYIIDDAAGFQLPVRVEQPSCRAARSTVRHGRRLALKCNVSGAVTVRFRGRAAARQDVHSARALAPAAEGAGCSGCAGRCVRRALRGRGSSARNASVEFVSLSETNSSLGCELVPVCGIKSQPTPRALTPPPNPLPQCPPYPTAGGTDAKRSPAVQYCRARRT